MLAIYQRLTLTELQQQQADAVAQLNNWFVQNPKRRICKAQLWYGRQHKIKRNDVASQIKQIADELIRKNEVVQ